MSNQRITLMGGGSVGLCLAASFAVAGAKVTLMVRPASIDSLRMEGITVTGKLGDHRIEPGQITVEDAARPSAAARECDVLVVTTKAYDVAGSVRPYAGSAPAHAPFS